jgi:sec-independent protein translocase protein TatA
MKLFEGPGLIIILVIVLIIFGPKQLPALGKSLGKTFRGIRDGVEGKGEEDKDVDDKEIAEGEVPDTPAAKKSAEKEESEV